MAERELTDSAHTEADHRDGQGGGALVEDLIPPRFQESQQP